MAGVQAAGPGLGATKRDLLSALKRRGPSAVGELRADVPHTLATLREHLEALEHDGLVRRHGTRRAGRGRPEILWALTGAAEVLFPQRDGAVLRELVGWFATHGGGRELERFFAARMEDRRREAARRLRGKRGTARLAAVARMLSDEGYFAEEAKAPDGSPALRIYHCPVKDLVAATDLPCRAELGLVRELLGVPLARIEHAAHLAGTCTYAPRKDPAPPPGARRRRPTAPRRAP